MSSYWFYWTAEMNRIWENIIFYIIFLFFFFFNSVQIVSFVFVFALVFVNLNGFVFNFLFSSRSISSVDCSSIVFRLNFPFSISVQYDNSRLTFIQYSSNAMKPLLLLLTCWLSQFFACFSIDAPLFNTHCIELKDWGPICVHISFCSNLILVAVAEYAKLFFTVYLQHIHFLLHIPYTKLEWRSMASHIFAHIVNRKNAE